MSSLAPLPHLPLLRLHCSSSDFLRRLIEREPRWGHAAPGHSRQHGERGVVCYRLSPQSFSLQVNWRWGRDRWEEREVEVVPGSIVSLRLVLDDAPPDEITRLLDLPPTRAFGKGESGPHRRDVRDEGLWIHEVLAGSFQWPEEKVADLLALLRGRAGWRDVVGMSGVTWAGVTVLLRSCTERMGGLSLDARVLQDLVDLSLQCDVELLAE